MKKNSIQVDAELPTWSEIKPKHKWTGILLGNGASQAIWERFKYASLFEVAAGGESQYPLADADKTIFSAMNTQNFEGVLSDLATATTICKALGLEVGVIADRYESIQKSLVEAVRTVHVPWQSVPAETLMGIRSVLLDYDFVFSTNYDLLLYWAIMAGQGRGFKDYLWSGTFDLSDTKVWDHATKVLYLHGALHLYRLPSGKTFKRKAEPFINLLDLFTIPHETGAVPLFVSEGKHEDKLKAIYRSDYLSFAYRKFSQHQGPTVVFGHSLGESDGHIVKAILESGSRSMAVSLMPREPEHVMARKLQLHRQLPKVELIFFDATTHPLGAPNLRITA